MIKGDRSFGVDTIEIACLIAVGDSLITGISAIALRSAKLQGRSLFQITILNDTIVSLVKKIMGMVRLRVREFAAEKGWTLKEVSDRSGIGYSTIRHYARSRGITTVDFTYLHKLARTFDVMIEDLVEILEE